MFRTCFATLIALCGLTAVAPAQVYTTWYGPTTGYNYAPAYSNYSYSTGYGPLSVFDWRWWSGQSPYRNTAYYSSPWYGTPSYTAGYAPSYTAAYSPWYSSGYASTSYYAPSAYSAYSPSGYAMYAPALASADTCCVVPQSACCGTGLACAGGNCPGGNCAMNYSPNDGMAPRPDPNMSGSSGSRRFEAESDPGAVGPDAADPRDDGGFRRSDPNLPNDGYEGSEARGASYGPRPIEQRKDDGELPKKPTEALPDAEFDEFRATPSGDSVPSEGLEEELGTPEEPAAGLLDLDSKLTHAPTLPLQRHSLRARFGSPRLARANVDPATLPAPVDLRLVKK